MFLEIQKSGKKKKYYLAHSFRENDKVRKIRRYLGENLSKEDLEKYEDEGAGEYLGEFVKKVKDIGGAVIEEGTDC